MTESTSDHDRSHDRSGTDQHADEHDRTESSGGGAGTAEPRSHLVEYDQEQPEDATYEGGAADAVQPPPD